MTHGSERVPDNGDGAKDPEVDCSADKKDGRADATASVDGGSISGVPSRTHSCASGSCRKSNKDICELGGKLELAGKAVLRLSVHGGKPARWCVGEVVGGGNINDVRSDL